MLKRLIGEDITISTFLEPELWTVKADKGNIEQVLMNICVNARDIMPQGGQITIKTENIALSERDIKVIPDSSSGKFIRLSIEDTGTGIPLEILDKIFEPFFSTKAVGKGTGLGLSVVYGIVKKHLGWINVYSELKQGTVFKIYLPATEVTDRKKIAEKEMSPEALYGNGERILVIEDEPGVLDFAQSVLRQSGYIPFPASDGKQARSVFKEEAGNFDLILSDIVLPDINGYNLVMELLNDHPEIPIILCSGYTEEKVKLSIIEDKGRRFIQKPYSVKLLLTEVKKTIDESRN